MKNKIFTAIALVLFLLMVGLVGTWESTYTREVTCFNCTYDGTYQMLDDYGHVWMWEGEGVEVGYNYKLTMDDNHTTDIYDDVIKKIEKIGKSYNSPIDN